MISKEKELIIQLKQILSILKKYKWVIIIGILFSAVIGGVYAEKYVPKVYYATAKMYIRPNRDDKQILSEGVLAGESLTVDFVEIVKSSPVLDTALLQLGMENEMSAKQLQEQMDAYAEYQSRILILTVADLKPERAQDIANAICDAAVVKIREVTGKDWAVIADRAYCPEKQEYPVIWEIVLESILYAMAVIFWVLVIASSREHKIETERDVEDYLQQNVLAIIPKVKKL